MRVASVAMGGLLASLLAGCQSLDSDKEAALSVAPMQEVRHGISRPEAQYAIGRYLQGQIRYDEAIATYRRLLETHPQHTEARNALGLILAAQGKYDQAIVEFETAAASAPGVVAIRNNLGYAYLLQGNAAQAIAVLEAARTLDPTNRRVLDNLDMALASNATQAHHSPVAAVTADAAPAGAAPDTGAAAAMPLDAAPQPVQPVPVSNHVLAVSAGTEKPAGQAGSAPERAAAATERPARLEISNGNGITRMARDTAHELAEAGYARPRLTNMPPYQLPATEIQYRPGFEAQALRLRETLRNDISVAPSTTLRWDVQLRLALGKDVKSTQELMAPKTYAQR